MIPIVGVFEKGYQVDWLADEFAEEPLRHMDVSRYCLACAACAMVGEDVMRGADPISPEGIVHLSGDDAPNTLCGQDAAYWWWSF